MISVTEMSDQAKPRLVIFTDLDGTLLDHDTYDFSPALPALAALGAAHVPLLLCSSKTHAELKYWSALLNINHPFISENGGALCIPPDYFRQPFDFQETRDGDHVVLLGTDYSTLRSALTDIAKGTSLPLAGFGDLSVADIAARTGLPLAQAMLAKRRDADEPFFVDKTFGEEEVKRLETAVALKKLRMTRGGRFFHLTGDNDKGAAARRLAQLYRAEWRHPVRTVGLGDSPNDLPLLQAVDVPIVVRNIRVGLDWVTQAQLKARRTAGVGPTGWNDAVLALLR